MALHTDDIDGFGAEAPRPVDEAALEQGAFARLSEGQGAVGVRRSAAAGDAGPAAAGRLGRRTVVALAVVVAIVVVLGVSLFVRVLGAAAVPSGEKAATGSAFELVRDGGGYALVQNAADGTTKALGVLDGEPVELFEVDDTIVVPQNRADGTWDVQAYTMGVGWSPVVDERGEPQTGAGTVAEAWLDGSTLVLTVDGGTVNVPLTW